MDLMNLQDGIDSFQKLIFAHFRGSTNNECRISALVPQVKESYGIYRFITSMLRAMHRRESLRRPEAVPIALTALMKQAPSRWMLSNLCESATTLNTLVCANSTTSARTSSI